MCQVKQISADVNSNQAQLPIQLHFTNVMIAMNCMGQSNHKINVVNSTMDNRDSDVKVGMESTYIGNLAARDVVPSLRPA